MKSSNQKGIAHLGLLLLLVIVAVIAAVGYRVMQRNSSSSTNTTSSSTVQVQTIKTAADLNNAESTLSNQNVDGDLNPDSLNQDVNSLL